MGQTMVEKILSKNIGKKVYAGDEMSFEPDLICAYDYPGYIDEYERQLTDELGLDSVKKPEKFLFFIDHFNPAGSREYRNIHVKTRNFAKKLKIKLYEDVGIGHQVVMEKGYITPGMFLVHFDGHISTLGALGAFALNIRNSMIEVFATQKISLVVPETLRINLEGELQKGVTGRDLFHEIVRRIGADGASGVVIEYGGNGLKKLSLDDRFTIGNQAMFLSALTSIMEPDEEVDVFLEDKINIAYKKVFPDKNAKYTKEMTVDMSLVSPILVEPPSNANTVDISKYEGRTVNVGYIGSCSSGRIEDFERALEILDGKKIKEGFRLEIVPSSVEIQKKMANMGIMQKLIDVGASIYFPTCDFCYGAQGVMHDGETALSTGTLNIPGRMGNKDSDIFLCSSYSVAAAALTGKITDPRKILK